MILYISEIVLRKKIFHIKNGQFWFKEKFSSFKMNNVTVIELKALAKLRSIKGNYELRNIELIHKLETHPDVN